MGHAIFSESRPDVGGEGYFSLWRGTGQHAAAFRVFPAKANGSSAVVVAATCCMRGTAPYTTQLATRPGPSSHVAHAPCTQGSCTPHDATQDNLHHSTTCRQGHGPLTLSLMPKTSNMVYSVATCCTALQHSDTAAMYHRARACTCAVTKHNSTPHRSRASQLRVTRHGTPPVTNSPTLDRIRVQWRITF